MWSRSYKPAGFAILSFLLLAPGASTSQHNHDKSVWNYDGGIFFETDGSLSNGTCFRVSGHATAPRFFDNLKRVNDDNGVTFRRESETVTAFPEQLFFSFVIRDLPCSTQYQQTSSRTYLTRAVVASMRLNLYWKHGVELRPIKNATPVYFSVEPVVPYAAAVAHDLPEKFEWFYRFAVPSAGVPLSDSLVLIIRTPDNRIAARVAARL